MLKLILEMLQIDEHYNQSEVIDIAKGKYELPTTWKQTFKQIKREWKTKK